jgi:hypothetical protein
MTFTFYITPFLNFVPWFLLFVTVVAWRFRGAQ